MNAQFNSVSSTLKELERLYNNLDESIITETTRYEILKMIICLHSGRNEFVDLCPDVTKVPR
jgi:hypothetical protein